MKPPREGAGGEWAATPPGRHLPLQRERNRSTGRGVAVNRGVGFKGGGDGRRKEKGLQDTLRKEQEGPGAEELGMQRKPWGRARPGAAHACPVSLSPGQLRSYRVGSPKPRRMSQSARHGASFPAPSFRSRPTVASYMRNKSATETHSFLNVGTSFPGRACAFPSSGLSQWLDPTARRFLLIFPDKMM